MSENPYKIFVLTDGNKALNKEYWHRINDMKETYYVPFCLGQKDVNERKPEFLYEDDNGDNIAYLNPYINEVTGMYYVYKHYQELGNPDNVGFVHYKRWLFWDPNLVGENTIQFAVETYRISGIWHCINKGNHLTLLTSAPFMSLVHSFTGLDIDGFYQYLNNGNNLIYGREMFVASKKVFFHIFENFISKYIDLAKDVYGNMKNVKSCHFSDRTRYFSDRNDTPWDTRAMGFVFEICLSYYIYELKKQNVFNVLGPPWKDL